MTEKYEIDSVDRQILNELMQNARAPFIEIARKLIVSGGTIHQRVDKMKAAGIIEGSTLRLNLKKLGFDVTVFLGVHLKSTKDMPEVIEKLNTFPEVVEAHFTTGNYALLLKINTSSISDYHQFLVDKLQSIESVQATESFISLDQPISKEVAILSPS
ncbi:MAG: transcriptional regulator AsnC [Halobacteriovoraceae bacterium]|nr:transcriptional regulator AsnC [Halobacteriovoraceae bacterium]